MKPKRKKVLVLLFFPLSVALIQKVQCKLWGNSIRPPTRIAATVPPCWPVPPGGSLDVAGYGSAVVIGTVGGDNTTIQIRKTPSAASALLPSDSLESLAIVSDVLIWKVPNPTHLNQDELDAIWKGAQRRASAEDFGKVRLLVVVEQEDTTPTSSPQAAVSWEETRDHVVHRLGTDLPSTLGSFDVVPSSQQDKVLLDICDDVMTDIERDTDESLLLLSKIYLALTSNDLGELHFATVAHDNEEDDVVLNDTAFAINNTDKYIGDDSEGVVLSTGEETTTSGSAATSIPAESGNDDDPAQVLMEAQAELERLEVEQLEEWLEDHASDSLREASVVKFGEAADAIFDRVSQRMRDRVESAKVLERLMPQMQGLFQNQLDSLRDHYGRAYERLLESATSEQAKSEAARNITAKFRAAAKSAIPKLCQEGGMLRDAADFSYIQSLQGLLSDMMTATEASNDGLHDVDEGFDTGNETQQKKAGPAKWYQKLAARVLMLSVNYLQGWLAWQGIRRAAAERDRDMPKFPLF